MWGLVVLVLTLWCCVDYKLFMKKILSITGQRFWKEIVIVVMIGGLVNILGLWNLSSEARRSGAWTGSIKIVDIYLCRLSGFVFVLNVKLKAWTVYAWLDLGLILRHTLKKPNTNCTCKFIKPNIQVIIGIAKILKFIPLCTSHLDLPNFLFQK